jgi:hypothetical protein
LLASDRAIRYVLGVVWGPIAPVLCCCTAPLAIVYWYNGAVGADEHALPVLLAVLSLECPPSYFFPPALCTRHCAESFQ